MDKWCDGIVATNVALDRVIIVVMIQQSQSAITVDFLTIHYNEIKKDKIITKHLC
jgi:hypothetical protein